MAVSWQVLDPQMFNCPVGFKGAGIFCLCRGQNINNTGSSHLNKTSLGSSGKKTRQKLHFLAKEETLQQVAWNAEYFRGFHYLADGLP